MSKKNRHFHILRMIEQDGVESQQDLLDALEREEVSISQSTLSKDLKELGVIKVRGKEGRFRFVQTKERDTYHAGVMLKRELVDYLRETIPVGNLVLLKTVPGNASGLSKSVDEIGWSEVAGTIASVDTVMVITHSDKEAQFVVQKLQDIILSK